MIRICKKGINLYDTLMSGQCFRAYLKDDDSFDVVLHDRVINVVEDGDELIVSSNKDEELESVVSEYFDLNTDYDMINEEIIRLNPKFSDVVLGCKGYKVLRQDSLEMLISYIISQNNNVKRISKSIEVLCEMHGEKVTFRGKEYYLFPTYEKIVELDLEKLEPLKIGFRDKYIMSAILKLRENKNFLEDIKYMDTESALDELMQIKGIGMKVASCILLFAYARLDTFPVDTWVKKFVSSYYGVNGDDVKVRSFLKNEFKIYTGLCIQYMYHYNRNVKVVD